MITVTIWIKVATVPNFLLNLNLLCSWKHMIIGTAKNSSPSPETENSHSADAESNEYSLHVFRHDSSVSNKLPPLPSNKKYENFFFIKKAKYNFFGNVVKTAKN